MGMVYIYIQSCNKLEFLPLLITNDNKNSSVFKVYQYFQLQTLKLNYEMWDSIPL